MHADAAVRIVLVEDHALMREAVRDLLHEEPGLHVCAAVGSAEEALELAVLASADLVLIDLSLPKMSGIELLRALRGAQPGLCCLILSSHTGSGYVESALDAGARGYLYKGSLHQLHAAVRTVLAGEVYLSGSPRA